MAAPLFDDDARALKRRRALARCRRPFLAERIVAEWIERLAPVRRRFDRALVTGLPRALAPDLAAIARAVRFADGIDALAAEPEAGFDLILVMGEIDARDELPTLLRIIGSRLEPGGLLAGAFPGGGSLPALRAALHAADGAAGAFAARSHPRVEPGALAGLLTDAGLVDAVVDVDRVQLSYRSLDRLIGDLRDHAATNVLHARPRAGLSRGAIDAARAAFAAEGDGTATQERIDLIHFSGWAPPPNNRP